MKIDFTKASAAGNDFVIIDNRSKILDGDISSFVKVVSHRRFGIGADGVILVEKLNDEYLMKYYNSDGSLGSLCGNGARSTARFIHDRIEKQEITAFSALGKKYSARVNGDIIRLFLPEMNSSIDSKKIVINGISMESHSFDSGSPHVIIFIDQLPDLPQLSEIDVFNLGKEIRYSSAFQPHGINVNFVNILNEKEIEIRTYERGVEDETFACGTGSIASAIISHFIKKTVVPVIINNKGKEKFLVGFNEKADNLTELFLEGKAKLVFEGSFEYNINDNEMSLVK
jgi:diaminopimelate epimerase